MHPTDFAIETSVHFVTRKIKSHANSIQTSTTKLFVSISIHPSIAPVLSRDQHANSFAS
jgi:hypothetical protein